MMRGGRGYRTRPYSRSSTAYTGPPRQPMKPAGKVVPFNQCQKNEIPPVIDNQDILINCYDIKLPQRPVYRYELKISGKRQNGKTIDFFSRYTKGVEIGILRACITNIYDVLLNDNSDFFKTHESETLQHIYAYDRSSIFYSSLKMQNRDERNPFVINIDHLNSEYYGFLQQPHRIIATLKCSKKLEMTAHEDENELALYLDILLTQNQLDYSQRFAKIGTKFFDLDTGHDIYCGAELKTGHHQIVRVSNNTAVLEIRVGFEAFYRQLPLLDFVHQRWRIQPGPNWFTQETIKKLFDLTGIFVQTTHLEINTVFRIRGISEKPSTQITFDFNGEIISVPAYFQIQHNKQLRYPQLPCVIRIINGKQMFYPFECLKIFNGQKIRRDLLNKQQHKKVIELSRILPHENKAEIQSHVDSVWIQNQYIELAGVEISTLMNSITSEVLHPPIITYQGDAPKQVQFADWNIEDVKFVKPAEINALAVFYDENIGKQLAENAAETIIGQAINFGMVIHTKGYFPISKDLLELKFFEETIIEKREKHNCDYVLAFADGTPFHNLLKATEIATKVVTQQIEYKTIKNKLYDETLGRIIQKMNLKRGGYNQYFRQADPSQVNGESIDVFKSFMQHTMLMGIYIVHPDLDTKDYQPSTCGYAFSTNKYGNVAGVGFVYFKARETILSENDLRRPLEHATQSYFEKNNRYPKRVLVYRCGVSDGEIRRIQNDECMALFNNLIACMKGNEENRPKVNVIIVRRQHNTRIFKHTTDPRDGAFKQNVLPGTTAVAEGDGDIVMVSHKPLQGTAKPTIYSNIFPNPELNDLTGIFLKNITHTFCHMHEICNSSIFEPHIFRSAAEAAKRGNKLWISKIEELDLNLDPEELHHQATTRFNPQIPTRYCA